MIDEIIDRVRRDAKETPRKEIYWKEFRALLSAIEQRPRVHNLVEVGRQHGISTSMLALCTRPRGGRVISYDGDTRHFEGAQKRFERLGILEMIDMRLDFVPWTSLPQEDIDLLFIDGRHEISSVMTDFMFFLPRLYEGSLVAFHDAKKCTRHHVHEAIGLLQKEFDLEKILFEERMWLGELSGEHFLGIRNLYRTSLAR